MEILNLILKVVIRKRFISKFNGNLNSFECSIRNNINSFFKLLVNYDTITMRFFSFSLLTIISMYTRLCVLLHAYLYVNKIEMTNIG